MTIMITSKLKRLALLGIAVATMLVARIQGATVNSTVTLTVSANAGNSADDAVSQSSVIPVSSLPTSLRVSTTNTGRYAESAAGAIKNDLSSGSVAVKGRYQKKSLPGSGGFTATGGVLAYQFEVDSATTLYLESANEAAYSWIAPGSPSWNLSSTVMPDMSENVALNGSGSWEIFLAPGTYALDMNSVNSGNVAWAVTSEATGEFATVFNWGLGSPMGSTSNPILPSSVDDLSGVFVFDVVTTHTVRYYDPAIATGYDYSTAGTAFASLVIPDALPGGDDTFDLLIGSDVYTLTAGQSFDFTTVSAGGVSDFSIRGIDSSESLDPNDPTAFVTGLSFVDGGKYSNFTMSAVTSDASVPEPTSCVLWSGLGVMGLVAARRRRKVAERPLSEEDRPARFANA